MTKNRYSIIFICLMFLSYFGPRVVMAEEGVGGIEVVDTAIKFAQDEVPHVAYLYMTLKNNGDKKIENLIFEIRYYDEEECLIKKAVIKNKLTEEISPKETKKYKIRLRGDVFNERNEEYPYTKGGEFDSFDVKILNVKFSRK